MFYIVATPIGNLKDITLRALETLKSCDAIIVEDTRRSSILLNHYEIKKPLIILNDFNEARIVPKVLEKLQLGENLALISDAGTPLVSDPGFKLVRQALAENIPVDSIPGPTSEIVALTLSGLPPAHFLFLGYLPEKPKTRLDLLEKFKQTQKLLSLTYIFFASPYKLIKTLGDLNTTLGNIDLVIASELTKLHQSVQKHTVLEWLEIFKKRSPKGEYTCLFYLEKSD